MLMEKLFCPFSTIQIGLLVQLRSWSAENFWLSTEENSFIFPDAVFLFHLES